MGNHKFKLSDMMPNAWFYKLKEIGSRRRRPATTTRRRKNPNPLLKKQPPPPPTPTPPPPSAANSSRFSSQRRKSYYFTRESALSSDFPTKPKLDSQKSSSSVSAGCSCRSSTVWTNKSSDSPPDYSASSSSANETFRSDRLLHTESFDKMVALSSSDKIGRESNAHPDDIIIDVSRNFDKLNLSHLDLPQIVTKPVPVQFDYEVKDMKKNKAKEAVERSKHRKSYSGYNKQINVHSNRRHVHSPGLRLRVKSPRIGSRRIGAIKGRKSLWSTSSLTCRWSLWDSVAIVKTSFDPQRDFRESVMEMIIENDIKESKDLEDLLACYLSLNSDEYHHLIINVFKQIWFDFYQTSAN